MDLDKHFGDAFDIVKRSLPGWLADGRTRLRTGRDLRHPAVAFRGLRGCANGV